MFFRVKSAGSYQYLQIVHSIREGEKVRQQVFGTLGRLDELKASGRLEALIRSGSSHCEKLALIDAHAAGETRSRARYGGSGRTWSLGGSGKSAVCRRSLNHCSKLAATILTLSGPFISPCCIGFLPVAAIEPRNVGAKTISLREPKGLNCIISTAPWRSWARRSNPRAKRLWVHRAA